MRCVKACWAITVVTARCRYPQTLKKAESGALLATHFAHPSDNTASRFFVHLYGVWRGHGMAHARLEIDLVSMTRYVARGLEVDSFRRPLHIAPDRFSGMAH